MSCPIGNFAKYPLENGVRLKGSRFSTSEVLAYRLQSRDSSTSADFVNVSLWSRKSPDKRISVQCSNKPSSGTEVF